MNTTRPVLLVLCAIALAPASACSNKQRIQTETQVAKVLVSDEQEDAIGTQVHQELEKQGIRYLDDVEVNAYVSGLAKRVIPFAAKDRPGVHWHVHVIDDPKTVNAFATPGGHLYVYTGLLLEADNAAEVLGVISHEAGHVVARHSARQMVNLFGLQAVASLALGENPTQLGVLVANLAANGAILAHSRSEETEADEYGARYASAAGYDPRGIEAFFKKLQAREGKVPEAMVWLSSHPATPDRIRHIEAFIRSKRLAGSERGITEHARAKTRLLPAGSTGG